MKNVIGIFLCLCLSVICGAGLYAQDGTYSVKAKAGRIAVYNHDDEVIGYLRRGDRIYVTMFHQPLQQADGSYSEPVTFVEYDGEEGILYMESPDWLRPVALAASHVAEEEDAGSGHPLRPLLLMALGSIAMLFAVVRPVSVVEWYARDYLRNRGTAMLMGLGALIWCLVGLYFVYMYEDRSWLGRWQDVGLLKMLGGILLMSVCVVAQLFFLNTVVSCIAGMDRSNYCYYDNGMSFLVTFVGTWIIIVAGTWDISWKLYIQLAIAGAVLVYLCFNLRHVFSQRGILPGLMILLIVVTGVSPLCYVALEVLSRILEIMTVLYIVKFVIDGLHHSRFIIFERKTDEIVDYFDPETGKSRRLYKDGNNGYVDYSDGSYWGRSSDGSFFNRFS